MVGACAVPCQHPQVAGRPQLAAGTRARAFLGPCLWFLPVTGLLGACTGQCVCVFAGITLEPCRVLHSPATTCRLACHCWPLGVGKRVVECNQVHGPSGPGCGWLLRCAGQRGLTGVCLVGKRVVECNQVHGPSGPGCGWLLRCAGQRGLTGVCLVGKRVVECNQVHGPSGPGSGWLLRCAGQRGLTGVCLDVAAPLHLSPDSSPAGLWLNIPDYDAPTQMVKPKERNTRYVDAVLTIPRVRPAPVSLPRRPICAAALSPCAV